MLTFEEKLSIIESFPELERKNVSMGRINFHYEASASDKKNVVYHLHSNGNGFVYGAELNGYKKMIKGWSTSVIFLQMNFEPLYKNLFSR